MGIKNFSKAFRATRVVKYKDLKGKTLAIDAMTELYRAALGAKSVSALTDAFGNPTMHINVILSIVIELHKNNVNQIWVFDHNQDPNADFHNPMKLGELAKRRKRKEVALDQIKSITDVKDTDPLFSDDDEPDQDQVVELAQHTTVIAVDIQPAIAKSSVEKNLVAKSSVEKSPVAKSPVAKSPSTKNKLNSLEKQTFSVSNDMINDIKLMLTYLNIKFIEAPAGFEGEAIASYLTRIDMADAVFSGDTDPIAYGARVLYRRNPRDKQIYEYTNEDILNQIAENSDIIEVTIDDLLTAAMALGTDACDKTPGIGPATVLKKLSTIKLTDKQKNAMKEFTKIPSKDSIKIVSSDKKAFEDANIDDLVDWLVNTKSFSRTRITTLLSKATSVKLTHSKSPSRAKSPSGTKTVTKKYKSPVRRKVIK